ncbi:MAG: hypothetical protein PHW00_03870 [Clostridia bacterium]|nr:hypothetical protein [Clostridia bacterium]
MKINKLLALLLAIVMMCGCLATFAGCDGNTNGTRVRTKTITTLNDEEVTIPVKPQRIVALTGLGDLWMLDIKPVAFMNFYRNEEMGFAFEGCEELVNTQPFDEEEILSYDPDLILVYE